MSELLTRRAALGAIASISATGAATAAIATSGEAKPEKPMTARERYDFHLAELHKAAEEINPRIAYWDDISDLGGNGTSGCPVAIVAMWRTGRYEGDGIYEAKYCGRYKVRLQEGLQDGKRVFTVNATPDNGRKGSRMVMTEDKLEGFICNRVDAPKKVA
ncbi:hypothetical protein LB543_27610 [Mesorhizobium sp. ESP7-2]|uniref:hypothetical protein n=1 Tax=Mesorhizobium sp. ESP7-2 TaxID=2876622 RepID=UPI001CCEB203|nr:hypothetical protein [Mesorhizobium sp. ESP7-2]MBZ9710470.1 hypothetical protein [Mesorhizobium sp. ESP7-2]